MNKKILIVSILTGFVTFTCQVSKQKTTDHTLRTTAASVEAVPAFTADPSPAYLTPEQSLKTFRLPKG